MRRPAETAGTLYCALEPSARHFTTRNVLSCLAAMAVKSRPAYISVQTNGTIGLTYGIEDCVSRETYGRSNKNVGQLRFPYLPRKTHQVGNCALAVLAP